MVLSGIIYINPGCTLYSNRSISEIDLRLQENYRELIMLENNLKSKYYINKNDIEYAYSRIDKIKGENKHLEDSKLALIHKNDIEKIGKSKILKAEYGNGGKNIDVTEEAILNFNKYGNIIVVNEIVKDNVSEGKLLKIIFINDDAMKKYFYDNKGNIVKVENQ